MHTQNLNANSHWIVECTHCWDVVEPHVFFKCFLQVNSINKKIKLKIPFIFRIRLRCSNIYNKRLNFLYSTTLKIYQLKQELEQCVYIYIYIYKYYERKKGRNYIPLLFHAKIDLQTPYIYIYIYKYYERKKGRNYISRQACFVNRFTLQGFNERIFMWLSFIY